MASNVAVQSSASESSALDIDYTGLKDLKRKPSLRQPLLIDIRDPHHKSNLREDVLCGLRARDQKSLPTLLFYNANGLKLFERITHLDEYYLTQNEIDVFVSNAQLIVSQLPAGVQLLELGSGGLGKIQILLDEFERQEKDCHYIALDLDASELLGSFDKIDITQYNHVHFSCLHGTYYDGLRWLSEAENKKGPICIMSIGSSLGNFDYEEVCLFLRTCAAHLYPMDKMLIGLDSCEDETKIYRAYNDSGGVTKQFYFNALAHANEVLGSQVFKHDEWELSTLYNAEKHCHEAYFIAKVDFQFEDIIIKKAERIFIERAKKYPSFSFLDLWADCGLVPKAQFGNPKGDYFVHILESAHIKFPKTPKSFMANPLPSLDDFEALWHAWDLVTLGLVPVETLRTKPIGLRHDLIFYLGHTPTFSDMQISRITRQKPTEPAYYSNIFGRGIDPDVKNPKQCHRHSEVPDVWPPLQEILQYRNKVRARIRSLLGSNGNVKDPHISRALWIGFEHEAMHLETFLYMLIHCDNIRPAKALPMPNFELLARATALSSVPAQWRSIPSQLVSIGMNGPFLGELPGKTFCWDNEMPMRPSAVQLFWAQNRPITNRDYALQLERTPMLGSPASWVHDSKGQPFLVEHRLYELEPKDDVMSEQLSIEFVSEWKVRTIHGKIPLIYALDWPVMASYDQLNAYAKTQGCRIPTLKEAKAIYQTANNVTVYKRRKLTNGGSVILRDSLPQFVDLSSCNVGFRHWHPMPVTHDDHMHGHADFGGIWEWTSTVLEKYEGFQPMPEYPEYTSDFFDGKHNIVLGGSWATHPRIAGRTSFVNWFQRDYPFAWAGARLVKNL